MSNSLDSDDVAINSSVAIIGISCRFPGANNLEEFWKLLIEGQDAIGLAPEGRWTHDNCPVLPDDSKHSQGGFLKSSIEDFDGKFFGMSPMELSFMDPQQRLTLQVAWEALEDAGIDPASVQNSHAGVFAGSWRQDYRDMLIDNGCGESEYFRTYMGNCFGLLSGRLSHVLGLTGPSITTESGCSSSMVAVDLACKSLRHGETDLSLACGVNLLTYPFTGSSMKSVLAPDGHCKTFDANADGFGRADGCGVLVLKRYADAVRDGDRVYALVRGSAVVQEGASKSLGTPTKFCEALAMTNALKDAGVRPSDVSFVETHGTGTQVGDPLEVSAVAEAYHSEERTKPLVIGSVKTNIGHTESCSGIAGIIKTVLCFQHEMIPPHRNFTTLNPSINLESIPGKIPVVAEPWTRDSQGKPRIAGVSSFGITGTDTHAILQEAPIRQIDNGIREILAAEIPVHILALSAKTEEALGKKVKQYERFLESNPNGSMRDVEYSANTGRSHFQFRTAVVGKTMEDILKGLQSGAKMAAIPEVRPNLCFLFTGQGSQYPGMAKALYDSNPIFKVHFEKCEAILNSSYGISIRDAIWGKETSNVGRTIYSQTSIFVVEYCLLKLWESWGVKPDFVLGHSLGEFGAAVAAGILSFEDGLKLVAERSRLIDSLPGGKMIVLKANKDSVDILMKEAFANSNRWLDYAAENAPDQIVLAGSEENVMFLAEFCKNNGTKSHILDATHAFHSRDMDAILEEYRAIAASVTHRKPTCGFISGMDGQMINSVDAEYWIRHTRERVRFVDASKAIAEQNCRLFLEIGPHPVLSALVLGNSEELEHQSLDDVPLSCLPSIRRQDPNWLTMLNSLSKLYTAGVHIDWKRYYQFSSAKKTALPFYPFQNKPHWFDLSDQGPRKFHPLVGSPLPNASSVKLYCNNLELENATTTFLQDHVIGSQIIFPGAGFIEMCLVAGHAGTQCTESGYFHPVGPITIENFLIESPLSLVDKERTQLQVTLSSEDSGEKRIEIYSKSILDKDTYKWIRHATSTFSPFAVLTKEEEQRWINTIDVSAMKPKSSQKELNRSLSETYNKLTDFGLKFGSSFQTIRNMWHSGADGETLFEVAVTARTDEYICHPVLTDALFQAIMFAIYPKTDKLHVPVSVKKFISFSRVETESCFIRCQQNNEEVEEAVAALYDSNGKLCSLMVGAMLVETNVSSILSALEAQKLSIPNIYEDVWKVQLGPKERRADPLVCFNSEILFCPDYQTKVTAKYNELTRDDERYVDDLDLLCSLYMRKALLKLGWEPELGCVYDYNILVKSLNILPSISGFFRYILIELTADGYFDIVNKSRDEMTFMSRKKIEEMETIESEIERLRALLGPEGMESEYVSSTGIHLAEILTGKESALPHLFPEDSSAVSAEAYYLQARMSKMASKLGTEVAIKMCESSTDSLHSDKKIIRVLEVGAGTGSGTKCMLPCFQPAQEGWEYTYTDLSPAFFSAGEEIFKGSRIKVVYRVLNIEQDPVAQGFIPHHYDWIIANNVIHATKCIKQTLANLRALLTDNGMITIIESIKPCRPTNITFGCLEGYWLFTDFQLRPYGCEISLDSWRKVLHETGFGEVVSTQAYREHMGYIVSRALPRSEISKSSFPSRALTEHSTWIVFSLEDEISTFFGDQLLSLGNRVVSVTKSKSTFETKDSQTYALRPDCESDFAQLFHILSKEYLSIKGVVFLWGMEQNNRKGDDHHVGLIYQPYLSLCQQVLANDVTKLYSFTRGSFSIEDHFVSEPTVSPIIAMTKCIQNEHPDSKCRVVDLEGSSLSTPISREQMEEAFSELVVDDGEIYVAYRGHQRIVPRFHAPTNRAKSLSFPSSDRFQLILSSSNAIANLRFGLAERKSLQPDQVEVRVKSYALNFKDVLVVLKPSAEFEKLNNVGIDFAGVVTAVGDSVRKLKIGDAVMGCNLSTDEAMPSHILTFEDTVISIPESMTFNEAATLPAVAATAYLSLVQVAKLRREDTILIHAGSGGVGLVAIQIAQHIGATIIATAGNEKKRSYLRRLGVKHVFHSRNTSYEKEIRQALDGRGVDVVLNSLTSEGFKEASLSICNEGARFIEMSKLNTWMVEEVKEIRPDVKYTIVDLSAFNRLQLRDLLFNIRQWMEDSLIRPIPYTRFDISNVREALTYLQKAKHIGKIICVLPDIGSKQSNSDLHNSIPLFNERSTYLITGGLGGIGWEVAKWMVKSGAKHVALVGRNPPNPKVSEEILQINNSSKKNDLFCLQFDIGNLEDCRALLGKLNSMDIPPLRGIMHAAGVLSDASFANQTWEKYERTFHPKINGGWNLHTLTLAYPLEHFVMFSSFVAKVGSAGQSNHASANFFLDSLSAYRNYIGLPATTINWGQWSGVGAAAEIEILGLQPFTPLQGISALDQIMRSQMPQAVVLDKFDFDVYKRILIGVKRYFEDIKSDNTAQSKVGAKLHNYDQFWKSFDDCSDTEAKVTVLRDLVRSVISSILKLDADFGDESNFTDLGMDSLMMIEMKNAVQSIMGKRVTITVTALKDCQNVTQLALKLMEMIGRDSGAAELEATQEQILIQMAEKNPELVKDLLMSGDPSSRTVSTHIQTSST
jgi:acyl transferase domain-containing protein/NADPH:quinone reductase-like Zn-dependent oxidoreductase/acyl carrier protein